MTSAAGVRAWARGAGLDVTGRGQLPADVIEQFNDGHPEDPYEAGPAGPGDPAGPGSAAGPPPAETIPDERKPGDVPGQRRRLALPGRRAAGDKGKKKPRKHPRVPVDRLIARSWETLGNFVPMLPTKRIIRMQGPVVGLILEDTIRGTVVDKFLQPLARADEKGKAMFAVIGPPMLVTALCLQPDAEFYLLPVLRESLLIWMEVAGPRMEEAMRRETEFEENYGATVDALITMIFKPPAEQSEADTVAKGQTVIRGETVPE